MIRFALVLLLVPVAALAAPPGYKFRLTANDGNRMVDLDAETYVASVLAGESSSFQSDEALKAMAVVARTWAAYHRRRHAAEGFDFCSTTHCQRAEPSAVTSRLTRAAQATAGELLWFEARLAFTPYTRSCGGQSATVEDIWPDINALFLRSHPDPYCSLIAETHWSWSGSPDQIASALRQSNLNVPAHLREIHVLTRTPSKRARVLQLIGDSVPVSISATSLRFAIGRTLGWNTIRSEHYDVANSSSQIRFTGSGEGHGVGLCQRGAEEMGRQGFSYRQILGFYFPSTKIGLTGTGLPWTHLAGERVALLTTHPDRDRRVLSLAETLFHNLASEFPRLLWPEVTLRVYPDLETFRNATGEPGWVAARTQGTTIDLQPPEKLDGHHALAPTLRHELLHVGIEQAAAPGTPLWFREGLVACFTSEASVGMSTDTAGTSARATSRMFGLSQAGSEIRQRVDSQRARNAYRDAEARVADLIRHYGAAAALTWLERGLPTEVTNSNASNARTNSR